MPEARTLARLFVRSEGAQVVFAELVRFTAACRSAGHWRRSLASTHHDC